MPITPGSPSADVRLMRALVLDRRALPEDLLGALQVSTLAVPRPGPGQVRVRVEAAALNPTDHQRARYGIEEWEWPAVLGLDVAGVVDEVGPDVTGVRPGQRVAFVGDIRRRGGFAELTVTEADVLAPIPDDVDATTAAALPSAGLTAYQAVHRKLHVGPDDTVLVTGAAGGVGGFAVQLAARTGARVIATASARDDAHVVALGADTVVDYWTEDVGARVRELTNGRGVDAVVDTVSPASATAALGLLSHNGRLAAVAGRPDLGVVPPFSIAPSLHEVALGAAYTVGDDRSRLDLSVMLTDLLRLVQERQLDARVTRTVGVEEVPAALVALAEGGTRGKTVLVW